MRGDAATVWVLAAMLSLVACSTPNQMPAGETPSGASSDEKEEQTADEVSAPPCGRDDLMTVGPWHAEPSSCEWRPTPPPQCGGAYQPAMDSPRYCVCHECRSDADCTREPDGRCVTSSETSKACSLTQQICVYPGEECHECDSEAVCVRRGPQGPYCHTHDRMETLYP